MVSNYYTTLLTWCEGERKNQRCSRSKIVVLSPFNSACSRSKIVVLSQFNFACSHQHFCETDVLYYKYYYTIATRPHSRRRRKGRKARTELHDACMHKACQEEQEQKKQILPVLTFLAIKSGNWQKKGGLRIPWKPKKN